MAEGTADAGRPREADHRGLESLLRRVLGKDLEVFRPIGPLEPGLGLGCADGNGRSQGEDGESGANDSNTAAQDHHGSFPDRRGSFPARRREYTPGGVEPTSADSHLLVETPRTR